MIRPYQDYDHKLTIFKTYNTPAICLNPSPDIMTRTIDHLFGNASLIIYNVGKAITTHPQFYHIHGCVV